MASCRVRCPCVSSSGGGHAIRAIRSPWLAGPPGVSASASARRPPVVLGIDYSPRHARAGAAGWGLYLAGSRRRPRLRQPPAPSGPRLMVAEGQAEPWEAVTPPPAPEGRGMYSCLPEDVVGNYNSCLGSARQA